MKKIEIKEELPLFSIETNMVPPDGELRFTDTLLSEIVHNYYKKERKQQAKPINVYFKKKYPKTQNKSYPDNYDVCTGLLNPSYMSELVKESLQLAKASDKVFAFLYLQVNGLNAVKNKYDDMFVNDVLITVAKRLKLAIRKQDFLSHLNGNKYIVGLLIEKNRLQKIDNMLERITKRISKSMNVNEIEFKFGVNSSVAAYPIHGDKLTVLLDIAKMKMHQLNKSNEALPTN